MVFPPAWLVSTLRKIDSVPSVTMIDGTLATATNTPLTSPRPAPMPIATATASDRREIRVVRPAARR